jgi:hypothetical protein
LTIKWSSEILENYTGIVEYLNGVKRWYLSGKLHRLDGPAIEYANGTKHWYQNGMLHRVDGPAIEYSNGDKHWFLNDKIHRVDGPAVEYANGTKVWYLNGIYLPQEKWFERLSEEDKLKAIWNLR